MILNRIFIGLNKFNQKNLSTLSNLQKFNFANDQESSDKDFQKVEKKKDLADDEALQQIDQWVKGNKVVLFMKGSPQMPMCGFSNFVVEVLKFYKIKDYYSVDILANEVIRKQVKIYSNWPTYPQLYINGNLVGGSDILDEMHKDGSFKELITKSGLP